MPKKKAKKPRKKQNAKKIPPGCVDTLGKVAKKFGVTISAVKKWRSEGMPSREDGFFDIEIIRTWKHERLDKKNNVQASWDAESKKWKAKQAELKYKQQTGELISRKEVEEGRVARIQIVKRAFLALPREAAPILSGLEPREVEIILRDRIKQIIRKFSQ